MGVRLRDAGNTLRVVRGLRVRDAGNVIRTIKTGKVRDSGATLRTFYTSATFAVTPLFANVYGSKGSTGATKVVSANHTLTVVGGSGVTFAWSRTAGDVGVTCPVPTANPATFQATMTPGNITTAQFQCVCTDTGGASITVQIIVTLELVETDPYGGTA